MASNFLYIPPSGGGSGAGVSSFNTLTGAVTISAGTNITLTTIGNNIAISASGGGGSGTVTSVSVVSANGFAGSVATATTTPAITLTTSITGVLKGNGAAISAATSGTDYSAGTSALATGILKSTTSTGALTIAVAADFPTLNQNTTGSAALNVLKAGDTMTGALTLPTGAAGTPSVLGGTSTTGMYFPSTLIAWSNSGTEIFRTNTLGLSIGVTSVQTAALYVKQNASNFTGILCKGTGTEWALNFANADFGIGQNGVNSNLYFDSATRGVSVQPGAGGAGVSIGYGFEVAYSSTGAAPTTLAAIVAKAALEPGMYSRSRNTTTGILNGFWSVGSSDRVMAGFYGVATTQTANSEVSYAAIATMKAGTLTEAARFDTNGNASVPGSYSSAAPQTTLTGSAGTAVCSQPFQGSSHKKVVVFLSGYTDTGTQTYTFPTAFTNTPYVYGLAAGVTGATATSTTIKFTVTTQTGFVFVEGY